MNLRKGITSFVLLLCVFAVHAQQTTVFTEATLAYKRGVDFFDQHLYGLAQKEFRSAIDLLRPANEPEWKAVKTDAELYYAKSAVRLGQPEAEKLTLDFLRENSPSPVASQAALEIGNYYFDNKEYDKALIYYDMAPAGSGATRDEIQFKKGYAYFVTKQFSRSKGAFASLKENTRSEWYYPANYYSACCSFFEKKFDEALKGFQRCEQSDKYKQYVPYYIAQIYSHQKKYDQVISFGAAKAKDSNIKNRPELNQLVGQAYYERGDYKSALPYLEFAANNGATLRAADYYQLGYAQYQSGFYKPAIENFEQLNKQDSLLGQNGLYHLGDSYLKTKNKFAARNAFGQAASMNYDKTVKEDALINYAKLSYELKFDRDAIDALQKIPSNSKYYEDAQALMSEVFLNTRDYDRAIATLEAVPNRTPRLNETYQKVCYYRGLQLYQNKQKDEARRYFNKSLENPIDKRIMALCSYWMGAISNESGEYAISKQHISSFVGAARGMNDLPEESNITMANYVQGYNNLRLKDYKQALANFRIVVDDIKRNINTIKSDQIKTAVLGDAVLRAGDANFKNNQYADALAYYNEAINRKYEGFEYALYQKAIIRGLQGSPVDKVLALEDLVNKYPNSRYTDEALFQMGETYQEMGKYDQAISPLRKLVADFRGKSPLINQALLRLGLISYNQGNTTAAISYYKQVFSNNPESGEAKDALAALNEIYVKDLNRPDEYFAFLETVPGYGNVSTSSKDSVTYQSAEIQFQQGKYQQAIEGFTNYLAKYPNGQNAIPAYYYRAESYASNNIKQYPKALQDYAAVVAKGPSRLYPKAAEKAALLALNVDKNYTQAFEFSRKWEESATTNNSRFDAQLSALQAAYFTNNSVAVSEYANKVTSSNLASNSQIALANFYLGKMAYDKNDFARAYPALQSVTENATTEIMAESWHLMAQILYKQRKYADAEQAIGDANKASAGFDDWIARNLILLSDVYMDQGDKNSASAALEAVLENYNGNDQTIMTTARQKYNRITGTNPVMNNTTQKGAKNLLDMDEGN
ncbi:MAG: tetratricopeptide repeat protein [Bacteroidetes bacterium]|nr:tetratricopeptide repeat protein [Bacteroidota bacterium]